MNTDDHRECPHSKHAWLSCLRSVALTRSLLLVLTLLASMCLLGQTAMAQRERGEPKPAPERPTPPPKEDAPPPEERPSQIPPEAKREEQAPEPQRTEPVPEMKPELKDPEVPLPAVPDAQPEAGPAKNDEQFEQATRKQYEQLAVKELSFEQFLDAQRVERKRLDALAKHPQDTYTQAIMPQQTMCGGGSFDTGIDPLQWQGARGHIYGSHTPNWPWWTSYPMTAGILGGAYTSSGSIQTWQDVSAGYDPLLKSLLPPVYLPVTTGGSGGAVRLGNSRVGPLPSSWAGPVGQGCVLSKTFVASQRQVTFCYAAVFRTCVGHSDANVGYFWVRVTDSADNEIPGAFNSGDGNTLNPAKLLAQPGNTPFFNSRFYWDTSPDHILLWRGWTNATINIPVSMIQNQEQVTVQFISRQCEQGGHWSVVYIDNFCRTCPPPLPLDRTR